MLNRIFDIIFSILVIVILAPVFLIVAILVKLSSRGPIIFKQKRVGKNARLFNLYKFRTMYLNSEKEGLLTPGNDKRITPIGKLLRLYKLDELPQFFNVLKGDMSIVGPRPEVEKYVNLYDDEQKKILLVKPGITDYASLVYINEGEKLAQANDPEHYYINHIMPEKIKLSLQYMEHKNFTNDLYIILITIMRIFFKNIKIKKYGY